MKSLNTFIGEAKKKLPPVKFEYDESPEWNMMTCGVDYADNPVIIFGEPCSRKRQDAWANAYKLAKSIGGNGLGMAVYQNLEKAFKEIEDEIGEELDEQQCLCICYLPTHDEWVTYTYGDDGVLAIK